MRAAPVLRAAPSPAPPDVTHDHSAGVRAHVTLHAVRRYGDRILGYEDLCDGLEDQEAVDVMRSQGVPVGQVRAWLAFYGGVGVRHGAIGVCKDGVGIVLQGGRVVTVVSKRGDRRRP